jgi:ribosomal protein L31
VKCNSTVAPTEDNHRRNLCDRCASVVDLTNYYIEDVGNCVECGIYLPLNDKGVCKSCDDERKKESTNFNFKHGSVTKTCVGCNNRFTIDFSAGKTPSAFCHLCETRLKSNICLKCHDYTNGIVDNYGRCEVCSQ